jgi:hypothetical protein
VSSACVPSGLRGLKLINKQIAFCRMLAAFNVYHYHSSVSQRDDKFRASHPSLKPARLPASSFSKLVVQKRISFLLRARVMNNGMLE